MTNLINLVESYSNKYNIEGYNLISNSAKPFNGNLMCFSDGRVIGSILDLETSRDYKLIIGLMYEFKFQFLKIEPKLNESPLIVYNLKRGNSNLDFYGKWIRFDNLTEYQKMLNLEVLQIADPIIINEEDTYNSLLNRIKKESLELFFENKLMDSITRDGQDAFLSLYHK